MKRACLVVTLFLVLAAACDSGKSPVEVLFSYRALLNEEFRFGTGKEIPLTVESSVERDGIITPDGKFLIYSSDRQDGNFDLYLRRISDITQVRITVHPSADISPSLSPDGRTLAFISTREDPEGDVYLADIDPESIIEEAEKKDILDYKLKSVNISSLREKDTGSVRLVSDHDPVWSPNGSRIAFSSNRSGSENIWLIDRNGKNAVQVTRDGGVYPCFSPDGGRIVYISYKNSRSGDLCIHDLTSNRETFVPAPGRITMYPVFMSGNEIIYTAIERDSDGNGALDLRDAARLYYIDLKKNQSYPLTLPSQSCFAGRWYPVYGTEQYRGIVIYSTQNGSNINLALLPDTGIIPVKTGAESQLELANKFLQEEDDPDRYVACLLSVYDHFGANSDLRSRVYTARALVSAGLYCGRTGDVSGYESAVSKLELLSAGKSSYAGVMLRFLGSRSDPGAGGRILESHVKKARQAGDDLLPYALEDLGDYYYSTGRRVEALRLYREITDSHVSFERMAGIHRKCASIIEKDLEHALSPSSLVVLEKGKYYQVNEVILKTCALAEAVRDPAKRRAMLVKKLREHGDDRQVRPLLHYCQARALFEQGDSAGARALLVEALGQARPTTLVGYLANILLGDIDLKAGENDRAAVDYYNALYRYRNEWKDPEITGRLDRLIRYYEERGREFREAGRYSDAAALYRDYTSLMGYIHRLGRFEELYNLHAPRAHVLYIDAVRETGEKGLDDVETAYRENLAKARMDFDKAHLYGLAYILCQKALVQEKKNIGSTPSEKVGTAGLVAFMKESLLHCNWSIFIDDSFVDSFILQCWMYQYLDLKRESSADDDTTISRHFPAHLLEKNIPLLEKALEMNSEGRDPDKEGDIHLNLANTYFLLRNYSRSLFHYRKSSELKKRFSSLTEEALFNYHLAYSLWQQGEEKQAAGIMERVLQAYSSTNIAGSGRRNAEQLYLLYRYSALFKRVQGEYAKALDWYGRIIELADRYSLAIDRARYYQEMAFCRMQTGDYAGSEKYLSTAWDLLSRYPNDRRKYPLLIKFFGLGPLPLWNLSLDSVVIGESRIFQPLDTTDKKLLNLSLQSELAEKRGSLKKSSRYLEQKERLLRRSGRDMDLDGAVACLNNIGYNYYRRGKYAAALEYFTRARNDALKHDSQEGIFTSTMNLVNCYASAIDNNITLAENPLDAIDRLALALESYKQNFYDMRMKEERKLLEKKAKSEKRKVAAAEINSLEEKIAQEGSEKNFSISVALAVLNFYRAELAPGSAPGQAPLPTGEYLRREQERYRLYSSSLALFNDAVKAAQEKGDLRLQVKLLLNAGTCHEKIFMHDEAYTAYIDARDLSERIADPQLMFQACFQTGMFLAGPGRIVEGDDFREAAAEHFDKALALVAETPLLFRSSVSMVEQLCDAYVNILLEEGNYPAAFLMCDHKNALVSVLMFYVSGPELAAEEDRNGYISYVRAQNALIESGSVLSEARIRGDDEESDRYQRLAGNYRDARAHLNALYSQLRLKGRRCPYAVPARLPNLPVYRDAAVSRIIDVGNTRSVLTLFQGKLQAGKLSTAAETPFVTFPEQATKRFLVLNSTLFDLLKKGPAMNVTASPVQLVAGLEDIQDVTGGDGYPCGGEATVYTENEKLFSDPEFSGDESLLPVSSAITQTGDAAAVAEMLFRVRYFRPECLVARVKEPSFRDLLLFASAARYAGIPCAVTVSGNDLNAARALISDIAAAGAAEALRRVPAGGFTAVLGGCASAGAPAGADDKARAQATERAEQLLASGRADDALAALMRHIRALPRSERASLSAELARVYMILSRYDRALEAVSSGLETLQPGNRYYRKLLSLKIYLLLAQGSCGQAREFMSLNAPHLQGFGDPDYYSPVLALGETGSVPEGMKENHAVKKNCLVEQGRLALLLSRYCAAFGHVSASRGILQGIKAFPMSTREQAAWSSLTGIKVAGTEQEAKAPVRDGAFWLDFCFGIHESVKDGTFHTKVSSDNRGEPLVANIRALPLPLLRARMFFAVSRALAAYGMHEKAYSLAKEGAALALLPEDSARYELLLAEIEASGGLFSSAGTRVKALDPPADTADRYWLDTIRMRMELARLAKLPAATAAEGAAFERMFLEAREMLNQDRSVIAFPGMAEITARLHDEYIRFNMATGHYSRALAAFTEKNLLLSGDEKISGPDIEKITSSLDTRLQPGDTFACMARNNDDVFFWLVSKNAKKAVIIKGGFTRARDLADRYYATVKELGSVDDISSGLEELFPDLVRDSGSGTLYLMSDRDLFTVPFEVAGRGPMLGIQRPLVFLSSLTSYCPDRGRSRGTDAVTVSGKRDSVQGILEAAALREAGMSLTDECGRVTSLLHFLDQTPALDRALSDACGRTAALRSVYFSGDMNDAGKSCYRAALFFCRKSPVVANLAPEKGINCPVFTESYYAGLVKNIPVSAAFRSALMNVYGKDRMKHPASWQGIRLFLPGFPCR
ncbi:MAG TPA: hypothetical protein PK926_06260 [Spirochaetota bacterium]|nr:hypothetical protein [Spirochaetota bacterium]HPI89091.1 hypothetical protein [Spirochaetota bacterium]HPR48698.1 hypothetical protein [Spirochaetota bacterium]